MSQKSKYPRDNISVYFGFGVTRGGSECQLPERCPKKKKTGFKECSAKMLEQRAEKKK